MLFIGLKERFALLAIRNNFGHGIREVQAHEQRLPETSRGNRDRFGISEVGRQQIARLIRAQKKTEKDDEESGYVFVSSE